MAINQMFEHVFRGFDEVETHIDADGNIVAQLRFSPKQLREMDLRNPLDLIFKCAATWPPKYQTGQYADRAPMRRRLALVEAKQWQEPRRR